MAASLPPRRACARLPEGARPTRYQIELGIDLQAATFTGSEVIELELSRPTTTITLHAQELSIADARVGTGTAPLSTVAKVAPVPRPARPGSPAEPPDSITVTVPAPLPAGRVRLALSFRGKLNTHLRGLYLAQHEGRRYAMTQFEGTEARRAFPCFDEPSYRARFQLTLTVPRGETAVSNTPVTRRVENADGRTDTVTFAETLPISSYLVAMAVGPLEGRTAQAGSTPITVYVPKGHAHLTEYALREAAAVLPRLEAWFGIPYPYGKLDLVAAPEFAYGGMENVGCILFRMGALLLDDKAASPGARRNVSEVIAHEIAHQWFGDLVTMAWWDDIWLNESFATWMEKKVIDQLHPDWHIWRDFVVDRGGVLTADELAHTHAIRSNLFTDAEDDSQSSPTIIYGKGSSVLRMVERWLGEERFQSGVRAYLRRHMHGNTRGADFFNALGEVSGQPVGTMAAQWVEQAGHPVVSVSAACVGGSSRLTFEQERLYGDGKGSAETLWQVPVCVRFPGKAGEQAGIESAREVCVLLKDRRQSVDLSLDGGGCLPWVVANAGAAGAFRVRYDDALFAALLRIAPRLAPEERLALLGDQWALAAAGRAPASSWFDVVRALRGERDLGVLEAISGPLTDLDVRVADPRDRAAVARLTESVFGPVLDSLGLAAPANVVEDEETRRGRALAFRMLGVVAGRNDVVQRARELVATYLEKDVPIDGALIAPALSTAARGGDAALYQRYLDRMKADRTPEERDHLRRAINQFEARPLVDRSLALMLSGALRTEEVNDPVGDLLDTRAGAEPALAWLESHFGELLQRTSAWGAIELAFAAGSLCSEADAQRVSGLFRAHPVVHGELAVALSLDRIRVCAARRDKMAPLLGALLASATASPNPTAAPKAKAAPARPLRREKAR